MKETEKALVTVSVEEVLPEQLEGINVIAKMVIPMESASLLKLILSFRRVPTFWR